MNEDEGPSNHKGMIKKKRKEDRKKEEKKLATWH